MEPQNQISITAFWKGNNPYFSGQLTVGTIELQGLSRSVSMLIPNPHTSENPLPLVFDYDFGDSQSSMKISIDQLERIKFVAGILEKSPYQGPRIMDSRTGRIMTQERMLRTERVLELTKKVSIRPGEAYSLVCTKNGVELVAEIMSFATILREFQKAAEDLTSLEELKKKVETDGMGLIEKLLNQPISVLQSIQNEADRYQPSFNELTSAVFIFAWEMGKSCMQMKTQLETTLLVNLKEAIQKNDLGCALRIIKKIEDKERQSYAIYQTIKSFSGKKEFTPEIHKKLISIMPEGSSKTYLVTEMEQAEELNIDRLFVEKEPAVVPAPSPKKEKDSCVIS